MIDSTRNHQSADPIARQNVEEAAQCGYVDWQLIENLVPFKGRRILLWDGVEVNTAEWRPAFRIGLNNHITVPGSWGQMSDSGRWTAIFGTHWAEIPAPPLDNKMDKPL